MKRRLRQHDQMYATMQQQGKPFEALEHLEKGLFVRKELHGPDHPEVGKVCQVFTTSCNTLAMNSLQRGTPRSHLFLSACCLRGSALASVLFFPMGRRTHDSPAGCDCSARSPCGARTGCAVKYSRRVLTCICPWCFRASRRQPLAGVRAAQEGGDPNVSVGLHYGQEDAHEAARGDLQQFWLLL